MTPHSAFFVLFFCVFTFFLPQSRAQKLGFDPFLDSMYHMAHAAADTTRVLAFANLCSMLLDEDAALARRFLDTAQMIHARHPTKSNALKLAFEEGGYNEQVANYEEAYKQLKIAVVAAESLNRYEYAIDIRLRLGDLLRQMKRPVEAESYYFEALERLKWLEKHFASSSSPGKTFNDVYALYCFTYGRLAKHFTQSADKATEVEQYLKESIAYADKVHPVFAAEARLLYGEFCLQNNKVAEAADVIAKVDATHERYKNEYAAQMPWYNTDLTYLRGILAQKRGDTEGAAAYLNQAAANFKQANDVKRLGDVYKTLTQVYQSVGNFSKAFDAQSQFLRYNDSLNRKEQYETINALEARYQNEKKQTQIDQQKAEIGRRRVVQWGLLAGLVAFLALAIVLYRQNQTIKSTNEQVRRQANQLEIMMQELHHRVKNNLQIVSSLLSLQSFQTSDDNAALAIREGQSRVEAMSLIHQKLYRTKDVSSLRFDAFARELTEKLVFSYGFDADNFVLKTHFDAPELDVDLAMPLGLMLNELLTNSFKYAFSQVAHPTLTIELRRLDGRWHFRYADNGSGLPPQYDASTAAGFGTQLITSLAQQLEGTARFWNEDGMNFELVFG